LERPGKSITVDGKEYDLAVKCKKTIATELTFYG
jgi:hypothetical protein